MRTGKDSGNNAAKMFGIPKGTLINKLYSGVDTICRMGPSPVLTDKEEKEVAKWILNVAQVGYPVHEEEVKDNI